MEMEGSKMRTWEQEGTYRGGGTAGLCCGPGLHIKEQGMPGRSHGAADVAYICLEEKSAPRIEPASPENPIRAHDVWSLLPLVGSSLVQRAP